MRSLVSLLVSFAFLTSTFLPNLAFAETSAQNEKEIYKIQFGDTTGILDKATNKLVIQGISTEYTFDKANLAIIASNNGLETKRISLAPLFDFSNNTSANPLENMMNLADLIHFYEAELPISLASQNNNKIQSLISAIKSLFIDDLHAFSLLEVAIVVIISGTIIIGLISMHWEQLKKLGSPLSVSRMKNNEKCKHSVLGNPQNLESEPICFEKLSASNENEVTNK
ncbi:MAG: hypothetical protein ABIA04_12435 [Pseudomonadota bacterium]